MYTAPIIQGFRQRNRGEQVGEADERYAVRSRHNALTCVGPPHWFAAFRLLL